MDKLHYDLLYKIFILLNRYDHSRCCLVSKNWYNILHKINWKKRNWSKFDSLAYHYINNVIPKLLANPISALNLYLDDYYNMVEDPDKYGTTEYCLKALISRPLSIKNSASPYYREYLDDFIIFNLFDYDSFKDQKDILKQFEQIIVPYICSGQLKNTYSFGFGINVYNTIYKSIHELYNRISSVMFNIEFVNSVNLLECTKYINKEYWRKSHFMNGIDLCLWFYDRNPDIFKKDFILNDVFVLTLINLNWIDYYMFDSFSREIKEIIKDGIKNKKEEAYKEIKNNFGVKYKLKLIISWLKNHSKLRSWILYNFSEWIFNLIRDRQNKLLKIFLKLEKNKLIKLKNSKGQTLYQYSITLKNGSPIEKIISKLKELNPPRKGSKPTKKTRRIKQKEILYNQLNYWNLH